MSKQQQKTLVRILVAGFLYAVLLILLHGTSLLPGEDSAAGRVTLTLLFLVPYLIAGYDIVLEAFENIKEKELFDECFLMMLATAAAFAIGEYTEAVAVMLFYQIGEWFQDYALDKSRRSIQKLMEMVPETANLERDGQILKVAPGDVKPGDVIVVRPGERIPLDGRVLEGESFLDTSALTGESVPRRVTKDDEAISGCVNKEGTLRIRVEKEFVNSAVSRILELVENAREKKARMENFITRFARYYTPAVTISAVILAIVPPLVLHGEWFSWIRRACVFLIVSCPCALVISVPLGFFGGIGAASRKGIMVKGSNYLELLTMVDTFVFDKTGTITHGEFSVTEVFAKDRQQFLAMAACAEAYSTHPIAVSLREAAGGGEAAFLVKDVKETAGQGIRCRIYGEGLSGEGAPLLVGSAGLLKSEGISFEKVTASGTVIYVALDGSFLGAAVLGDRIKEEAPGAMAALKRAGIRRTVMLSGDRREAAEAVADAAGLDECHAMLLPDEKVRHLEEIMQSSKGTAFVGDGINDAPVLMRSDVGIAMGALGSDAAIEAADVVLVDDDLNKLPTVIAIAKKTVRIVRENIVLAIAVKFLVLLLGAAGIATMWMAVFADVGVTVIAVCNSMRMLKENGLHKAD